MKRTSPYLYNVTEPPGTTVHHLRMAMDLSQRQLADRCRPPLNHTTIRRIENNEGYQKYSLEIVAKALRVPVQALFCPQEMVDIMQLPLDAREKVLDIARKAMDLYRTK